VRTACVAVSLTAVLTCAAATGCGASGSAKQDVSPPRRAVERYVAQVEPIRLGVNRLLEGADPVLRALHEHRISSTIAARQIDQLERRFAEYTLDIANVAPQLPALARPAEEYAHTYVLEDSYLSALASGLATGDLTHLPDTQAEQRAAIIGWRTSVTLLARKVGAALPGDLHDAGRGEIAPSAQGGS
jgi:hypothetical protein